MEFIESEFIRIVEYSRGKLNVSSSGGAAVCMDLGHLTLKRSANPTDNGEEPIKLKVMKTRFFISSQND